MTTEQSIEAFAQYAVGVRNLRPDSIKTYLAAVRDFQRRMPGDDLLTAKTPVLLRFMDRLYLAGRKVSTRRARRNGLRAYYLGMQDLGFRSDNPALRLPTIEETVEPPAHFTMGELNRVVFDAELTTPVIRRGRKEPVGFLERRAASAILAEPRNTAILGLTVGVGLRAREVGLIDRGDYNEQTGELLLRGAKGSKRPQKLWVKMPAVLAAMSRYLTELWRSPWAQHPALFPPFYVHERSQPGHGVSAATVRVILKTRIERAGIEPRGRRLSPHTFARYTLGTHLHNGGKDGLSVLEIAAILRHRSIETTRRYVNLGGSAKVASRAAFMLRDFGRGRVPLDSPKR